MGHTQNKLERNCFPWGCWIIETLFGLGLQALLVRLSFYPPFFVFIFMVLQFWKNLLLVFFFLVFISTFLVIISDIGSQKIITDSCIINDIVIFYL